jgi:hypothetical protein
MAIPEDVARMKAFEYVKNLGYHQPSGMDVISIDQTVGVWRITLRVETSFMSKMAQVSIDASTGEVHKFQIIPG